MLYKHQVTLAQNERSPTRTPRKTIPVTPLKTPKKSPVKVSVIRAQTEQYIGDKFSSSKYNVPTLTLTPVPLNVILRKKAKIVGKTMHRWAKGRWINQDPSMLSVPGNDPFGCKIKKSLN